MCVCHVYTAEWETAVWRALARFGIALDIGRMSALAEYVSDLVLLFNGTTADDDGASAVHAGYTALVQRIRDGDVAAFEELVLSLSRPLEAYAYRFSGSRDAAKDLIQDVFAHLWEGRATLVVRGSVRGYLYAAVRNRALDIRKRDHAEVARITAVSSFGVPAGMAESSYEADASLYDSEIAARVTAALDALPPRAREVALLRWRSGLGRAEIATVMGITISTVSNQLTLAARVVRALLADLRDGT